ncbi:MAG: hypothetical protein FJZ98_03030 [Chloroflexi bacterium]|nr:hypothetical protein [Chloroflexota bacterium]
MNTLSEWIYRKSTARVGVLSLILFLAFSALVLPGQSAAAESYSGETGSPDTSLFYSPGDLYRMAEAYGPEGRQAYIRARFTFDLAFPLVYGFFLIACNSWLLSKIIPAGKSWRLLNIAPLAGVLFDFLENFSAAWVIGRFPLDAPIFATIAPAFTLFKWIFVGGSFALFFVLSASTIYYRITKQIRSQV